MVVVVEPDGVVIRISGAEDGREFEGGARRAGGVQLVRLVLRVCGS